MSLQNRILTLSDGRRVEIRPVTRAELWLLPEGTEWILERGVVYPQGLTRTNLNPRDYVHVTIEVISLARRLTWQQLDVEADQKGN